MGGTVGTGIDATIIFSFKKKFYESCRLTRCMIKGKFFVVMYHRK